MTTVIDLNTNIEDLGGDTEIYSGFALAYAEFFHRLLEGKVDYKEFVEMTEEHAPELVVEALEEGIINEDNYTVYLHDFILEDAVKKTALFDNEGAFKGAIIELDYSPSVFINTAEGTITASVDDVEMYVTFEDKIGFNDYLQAMVEEDK